MSIAIGANSDDDFHLLNFGRANKKNGLLFIRNQLLQSIGRSTNSLEVSFESIFFFLYFQWWLNFWEKKCCEIWINDCLLTFFYFLLCALEIWHINIFFRFFLLFFFDSWICDKWNEWKLFMSHLFYWLINKSILIMGYRIVFYLPMIYFLRLFETSIDFCAIRDHRNRSGWLSHIYIIVRVRVCRACQSLVTDG